MKDISATYPVCVTLAGHLTSQYGKPVLMTNSQHTVTAQLSSKESSEKIITNIWSVVKSETGLDDSTQVKVTTDMPLTYHGTQAAVIVAMVDVATQIANESPKSLQNLAYEVEKKVLKQFSHAQTVACIQKGLIFYRKEFEFYKTVVQLPMELPKYFKERLFVDTSTKKKDVEMIEKVVKRLVYAISQENENMFFETLSEASDSEVTVKSNSHHL